MKTLFKLILLLNIAITGSLYARINLQGIVEKGGKNIITSGMMSTTKSVQTYPNATVTVYVNGTLTLATIYSDSSGTIKANPFTAASDASWNFFGADNGVFDIKFSGAGITTPWTLSGVSAGHGAGLGTIFSVVDCGAKGDGVTDDYAAIQSCINAAAIVPNATVFFPAPTAITAYRVNTELSVPTLALPGGEINFVGESVVYGGNQDQGSTIRAGAAMRSVMASESYYRRWFNLRFDGNRLATYGMYLTHASYSRFERVQWIHAKYDGLFIDGPGGGVSDNVTFENCWWLENGTVYASATLVAQYFGPGVVFGAWNVVQATGTVSTTAGSRIITGSGTQFLSMGLHAGDFMRIGPTMASAEYVQIKTVDSDTQITTQNLSPPMTTYVSSGAWATFNGAGLRSYALGGQNGVYSIKSGLARGNVIGINTTSFYGWDFLTTQLETSALWGVSLGLAGNEGGIGGGPGEGMHIDKVYFEGNLVASIWSGNQVGTMISAISGGDAVLFKSPTRVNYRVLNGEAAGFPPFQTPSIIQLGAEVALTSNISIDGFRLVSFVLELTNTAGTLQHRIVPDSATGGSSIPPLKAVGKIPAAVPTLTNTPSGGSAFAAGACVVGGTSLALDTANQSGPDATVDPRSDLRVEGLTVVRNSTGTVLYPEIFFSASTVNGITIYRPEIQFRDGTDTVVNINTTTIPAGKFLSVRVSMWIQ